MEKEKIMEKAIIKAQKNGYKHDYFEDKCYVSSATTNDVLWEAIIFSHDFARAFWGEIGCCLYCGKTKNNDSGHCKVHDDIDFYDYPTPVWQYHLQQMVISEDPIKYLEQFL